MFQVMKRSCMVFACGLILALPSFTNAAIVKFEIGGSNVGSIQATVDAFRSALGNPNNGNAPGPLFSGRREINWDGGGPPVVNGTAPVTPFTVFRDSRGATFTTPGTGLTQAADTGGLLALDLINPTYAAAFTPFSPNRLFTPIGSNITDVLFSVPGTGAAATVTGFGADFSDVDTNNTSLSFFDINNNLIFSDTVDVATIPDGGLSFLGGIATSSERISRVRITTGNAALGPNDSAATDVVVMDDVIYAEPRAIPEPAALTLMALGLLLVPIFGAPRRKRAMRG